MPSVVYYGRRLHEFLSNPLRNRLKSRAKDAKSFNRIMNREIDLVYGSGNKWLEVKNWLSISGYRSNRFKEIKTQLRDLNKVKDAIFEATGERIQITYLFLNGGVSPKAKKILEGFGVTVEHSECALDCEVPEQ